MCEQSITLQLGQYANFTGTHIWNARESIRAKANVDPSCIYRVDESKAGRRKLTPRLVMIDMKDNMAGSPVMGTEVQAPVESVWGGTIQRFEQQSRGITDFQAQRKAILDSDDSGMIGGGSWDTGSHFKEDDISVWSDFIEPRLHDKTTFELPQWAQTTPFDNYFAGTSDDILSADVREDMFDRFRYFAEETDNLKLVTIMADIYDGFGGLTSSLLEEIRSEAPSAVISLFAFTASSGTPTPVDEDSTISDLMQNISVPLCYANMMEYASMIVPIYPRAAAALAASNVHIDASNMYQTSAVIATAIDTILTPLYMGDSETTLTRPQATTANEWYRGITMNGRLPICSLEVCMPFPLPPSAPLEPFNQTFRQFRTTGRDSPHTFATSHRALNPFATSLSAAAHGPLAAPHSMLSALRSKRPYSNFLSIRGPTAASKRTMLLVPDMLLCFVFYSILLILLFLSSGHLQASRRISSDSALTALTLHPQSWTHKFPMRFPSRES